MKKEIELHWEITNNCNLRCKHCLRDSGVVGKNELTYIEINNIINKLAKDFDSVFLHFTGGEPFMNKNFADIMQNCVDKGVKFDVITNGTLLTEETIKFFKKNEIKLGVSFESFDKSHFEKMRGVNTYDKVVKLLKLISKHGVNCDLYCTINKYNIFDIDKLIEESKNLNFGIHFNEISYNGRAEINKKELFTKYNIFKTLKKLTQKYYNEKFIKTKNECWANTNSYHIDYNGNIFLCTEFCRKAPSNYIANIKDIDLSSWLKNHYISLKDVLKNCSYDCYYTSKVTFLKNCKKECKCDIAYPKISTLKQLNKEIDRLNFGCKNFCKNCNYPDCMGYIWLLPSEDKTMLENGIDVLTVNKNINFLSYATGDMTTEEIICTKKPKCIHRSKQTGKCMINKIKPFVCHLYPISIATQKNGKLFWTLYLECEFTKNLLKTKRINKFYFDFYNLLLRLDKKLYYNIIETYKKMDNITFFPNGPNKYIIIKEV